MESLLSYLGLDRIIVEFEVLPADKYLAKFAWGPEKENTQMEKCLNWLNYIFGNGNSQYLLKGTTYVASLWLDTLELTISLVECKLQLNLRRRLEIQMTNLNKQSCNY